MANDNLDPTREVVSPPDPLLFAKVADKLGDPNVDPAVRALLEFDLALVDGRVVVLGDPDALVDEPAPERPGSNIGPPTSPASLLGALGINPDGTSFDEPIAPPGQTASALMASRLIGDGRVRVITFKAHMILQEALELLGVHDVWKIDPRGRSGRGDVIEDALAPMYPGAQQTHDTFPVIDYYDPNTNTHISVKSINLLEDWYAERPPRVGQKVYQAIQALTRYSPRGIGTPTIRGAAKKKLVIVLPSEGITEGQVDTLGILTAVALGTANIEVEFIEIPSVEVSKKDGPRREQ